MQEESISKISKEVVIFFKQLISEIDKNTKFVKRKSKLTAQGFAKTLIVGCLSACKISLESQCRLLKKNDVKISKQGLHQRFNVSATELMQQLFIKSLEKFRIKFTNVPELLKSFTEVKIQDSTAISLPETFKNAFRGCGGAASESGLKIQLLLDYIEGQISEATFTEGCRSDQGFDSHLDVITKGALYLQDLGYFKLRSFKKIIDNGAYFISRYLYPTSVLNEDGVAINLSWELKKAGGFFDKEVWLGIRDKVKVRLIANRLPEEAVAKRICKIKRDARRQGKTPSKEVLEYAKWSIYVMNVTKDMLSDKQIYLVYSLRWQIELFFKLCKSQAGIDKISGKKADRVLCEIYAKLICVGSLLYICSPIKWQGSCELSFYKAYSALRLMAMEFFLALRSCYRLTIFIKNLLSDLKDFALKDRCRVKRRLTYQEILDATKLEAFA